MKLMRAGGASHGLESLVWEHRPHINLVRIASPLHADVDSRKRQVQDQFPKRLTEAEVIEAEEELKALQRHAFAIVDPEVEP